MHKLYEGKLTKLTEVYPGVPEGGGWEESSMDLVADGEDYNIILLAELHLKLASIKQELTQATNTLFESHQTKHDMKDLLAIKFALTTFRVYFCRQ